ncbi:MAG TPA: class I SAM-dependent methyltransferase [Candidatus Kapabacteria bacterium]|nr:class I SAM-dependent methyltransferase [Candidatus Kapabacteria bacterium]
MKEIATTRTRLLELEHVLQVTANERYYFGYQYGLGAQHIVPYLRRNGLNFAKKTICEIGCGEGGVLAALADEGASYALGIDIRQEALDRAEIFFRSLFPPPSEGVGLMNWDFRIHDVTNQETPAEWRQKFDFVTLRDVMEHLDDTEGSLRHVMEFLRPGGYLYIVFPPYYSPFGGHQHLLKNRPGKLPFLQFLPDALFKPLIKSGRAGDIEEVMRLRTIRLTIGKFRQAVKKAGLEIVDEELYFLRPVFKLKFGLPAMKVNALRMLPGLREVAALEAGYLLRMPKA